MTDFEQALLDKLEQNNAVLEQIETALEALVLQNNTPQENRTETQTPVRCAAVFETNIIKVTLKWLSSRDRQFITRHNEPEIPILENGAIKYIKPSISEWRIVKPVAFIYRELCGAAEHGEIPLTRDAIADFMINNLKTKNGKEITKDSLVKAAERTNRNKSR